MLVQGQDQTGGNVVSPKEVDYSYNALGKATSVVDFNTLSGPRTDVLTGTYGYDGDSRLTSLDYSSDAGANTIDSLGFTYSAARLVTSFSTIDGTASYTYDPTNQLTAASYTTSSGGHQPANESYSFTANGNRNSSGYSTGSDNLMSSDGTYDYEYDADGNRINRTQIASTYSTQYLTSYTWDYRNRLTDVEYYDNNDVLTGHVHFVYDVFNNLIGEEDDTTGSGSYDEEQWYVNEGGHPALQFDGSGNLTVRYFGGAQEQVTSLTDGGTVYWVAADKQGSVRDVVDNSGSLVDHVVYNAFGETAYESDPSIPHWAGYAGEHLSAASSLIISGARWYDASTGRWLSEDPSGFHGGDSNLQRYVANDPTNLVDPSGMLAAMPDLPNPFPQDDEDSVQHWTITVTLGLVWIGSSHDLTWDIVDAVNQYGQAFHLDQGGTPDPNTTTTHFMDTFPQAPQSDWLANSSNAANGFAGTILNEPGGIAGAIGCDPYVDPNSGAFQGGQVAGQAWQGAMKMAQWSQMISNAAGPCGMITCFVAGTPVLVPGGNVIAVGETAATPADEPSADARLFAAVLAGIGIAGFAVARRASSAEEDQRRRERAIRVLFGDNFDRMEDEDHGACTMNSDDPGDYERGIDALCDALFHGEQLEPTAAATNEPPARAAAVSLACRHYAGSPATGSDRRTSPTARPGRPKRKTPAVKRPNGLGAIWLAACVLLAAWVSLRAPAAPGRANSARSVPTPSATFARHASRAIETVRVGERVLGENPDLADWQHSTKTAINPTTWRLVKLHAEERWEDGTLDTIEVETLQPFDWLREHGARPGAFVPLPIDLTEMGLPEDMRAKVVAIEPCPQVAEGLGHVVTSTVSHLNRFLLDLEIVNDAGRTEKITATGYHKFYSATRSGWVSACELRRGEQLRGVDGALAVAAIARLPGVERVYNFSVEGEHVYHVSALGALVHNPDCDPDADTWLEPGPDDPTVIMPPEPPELPPGVGPVPGFPPGHPFGPDFPQNWPGLE